MAANTTEIDTLDELATTPADGDQLIILDVSANDLALRDFSDLAADIRDAVVFGGESSHSGDGATTSFDIAHGMSSTPTKYVVTPASADAVGFYISAVDGTNITVTFASAPASGTDNVVFSWMAA